MITFSNCPYIIIRHSQCVPVCNMDCDLCQIVFSVLYEHALPIDISVRYASLGISGTDDLLIVKYRIMASVHVPQIIGCPVVEPVEFVPSVERHHCFSIAIVRLAKQSAHIAQCLKAFRQDGNIRWNPRLNLLAEAVRPDVVPEPETLLVTPR